MTDGSEGRAGGAWRRRREMLRTRRRRRGGWQERKAAGEGEVVLDGSAVGVWFVCVGLDLDETVVGLSMRRPIVVTVFVFSFSIRVKSLVPLALVHVYSSTAT
jgi:hypothetical protein